ncbi:MAG: YraN family protein [Candidatus Hydrogenedens sp.]
MANWLEKIFPFIKIDRELTPRDLGREGEKEAVRFLKNQGLKVLGTNVRIRKYEIDLIARDGNELVFVEVKTCRNDKWNYPEDKVNYKKRKNLRKAGKQYIIRYAPHTKYYRFDIIAITWEPTLSVQWIKNAF